MTNKSKQKGTWTETVVVELLKSRGFDHAARIVLHGAEDHGDIDVMPGTKKWMLEVKGGAAAETASIAQVQEWLAETRREQFNGGYAHAALVVKRKGHGRERAFNWHVYLQLDELVSLFVGYRYPTRVSFPVSMQLGPFITLLKTLEETA